MRFLRALLPAHCLAAVVLAAPAWAQEVFINELHYDNAGADVDEGVEIAAPAGTDLSAYSLTFMNGANGQVIGGSLDLAGIVADQTGTGFGTLHFPVSQIQNGAPDGVVIHRGSIVIEFLSWEGTFVALGGPADGMTSTEIPFAESASTPVGHSLQKVGTGSDGADFSWIAPMPHTRGHPNSGQTFTASGPPRIVLAIAPVCIREGAGAAAATGTVTLVPPPAAPHWVGLASEPVGEIELPTAVQVGVSGTATFPVVAVADGIPDGDRQVTVAAADASAAYDPGTAGLFVVDADGPDYRGSSIRIMTFNIEQGIGPVGGSQFLAVQETIRRIDPDVIAFQELASTGGFAAARALLASLGFGTDSQHFATTDDAFADFAGGDFSGSQWVAVASRFPIYETRQVGRADGFNEVARYPLFVSVDVPGVPAADDPHFVCVHYKAGSTDADFFRKAVEGFRTTEFLASRGLHGTTHNLIVLGDCNSVPDVAINRSYSTAIAGGHQFPDGSILAATFTVGDDLPASLTYNQFPRDILAPLGLADLAASQVDGSTVTRATVDARPLDYLFVSGRVTAAGAPVAEIFNSLLEVVSPGRPKICLPLAPATSRLASDHLPVFADIELVPRPALAVALEAADGADFFYEDAAGSAAVGTVTLSAPSAAGESVTVSLNALPQGAVGLAPATLTFQPGESQQPFVLSAVEDGVPLPDLGVVVAAVAPGFTTGIGTVTKRNRQADGRLLVSQYVETDSGFVPKAVEIFNPGSEAVDFAEDPLSLRRYRNGSLEPERFAHQIVGTLGAGQVVVVGDISVGTYLRDSGLIVDPDGNLHAGSGGFAFETPGGDVGFILAAPNFTGNDAIEVTSGFVRADVFGLIGHDPGASWSGGNPLVRTDDSMLERRTIATRGSAGWTDPSLRFVTAGTGVDLTGFGVPPALASPFDAWIAAAGIANPDAHPLSDPDADGLPNAIEYYQGTAADDPRSAAPATPHIVTANGQPYLAITIRRHPDRPAAVATLEVADALGTWIPHQTIQVGSPTPHPDGSESVVLRVTTPIPPAEPAPADPPAPTHHFLRLRVEIL
ncbi:hypothetical protein BH23VER1_BH23VER1_08790 [soil metagenome]